jgi:hypothetical protein
MLVGPVAPSVGQLWHQTSVKSEKVPKWRGFCGWDGADRVVAALVTDGANIMKRALQVWDFKETLPYAHETTK